MIWFELQFFSYQSQSSATPRLVTKEFQIPMTTADRNPTRKWGNRSSDVRTVIGGRLTHRPAPL